MASAPKKPRSHPPYVEMIKEAIVALKERTGSSQYAIAKYMEENQKDLPSNFKKLLLVQLKKLVAAGKLTKVKHSFKLSVPEKPTAAVAKKAPAADAKKKVVVKPKSGSGTIPAKAKKVAVKPKAVAKPKKVAKTMTVTSPSKKKAATVKALKAKKTPVKTVKKPKSIKSPVKKKAPATKGKK